MDVSIVIRSFNEEKRIGECLEGIFSQKYSDFEVIVVDSESTDNTLDIIKKFDAKIIPIKKKDFSYGGALNTGIKNTVGEKVALLSAHAIPVENAWLGELVKDLDESLVAGVYGKQLPLPDCNPFGERIVLQSFGDERRVQTHDPFFSNSNSAILKKMWEKDPFDETLPFGEDQYWVMKQQEKGYKVIYEPRAGVYHSHNETLRQRYNRARNLTVAFRDVKDMKMRYGPISLFGNWVAGTWGDIKYVAENRDRHGLKWVFYAPFWNFANSYGIYRGITSGRRLK